MSYVVAGFEIDGYQYLGRLHAVNFVVRAFGMEQHGVNTFLD